MGMSVSSESDCSTRRQKQCANLVSIAGELCQYPVPVTVSQVLQSETSSLDSFFVCNSDRLDFDAFIPSLDLEDELEPAQIYFVLPVSKLKHRLASSDMAALAVKASIALNTSNCRQAQISPVVVELESQIPIGVKRTSKVSTGMVSRSGSESKLKRYTSRRAKLAARSRSFRIRLATINEGSELLN